MKSMNSDEKLCPGGRQSSGGMSEVMSANRSNISVDLYGYFPAATSRMVSPTAQISDAYE